MTKTELVKEVLQRTRIPMSASCISSFMHRNKEYAIDLPATLDIQEILSVLRRLEKQGLVGCPRPPGVKIPENGGWPYYYWKGKEG